MSRFANFTREASIKHLLQDHVLRKQLKGNESHDSFVRCITRSVSRRSLYILVANGGDLQDGAVSSWQGSSMREANAMPFVFRHSLQLDARTMWRAHLDRSIEASWPTDPPSMYSTIFLRPLRRAKTFGSVVMRCNRTSRRLEPRRGVLHLTSLVFMPLFIGSFSMGSLSSRRYGPFTDPAMPLGTRAQDAGSLRDPCTTRFLSWLVVSSLARAPRPFVGRFEPRKPYPRVRSSHRPFPDRPTPIDRSTVSF